MKDLRPQVKNANRHTQRGVGLLEKSISKDGWVGALTVAGDGETFDGSARLEVAGAGNVEPIIVRSRGNRPIVHVREDIPTATDPRARRLAIAANRVAEVNLDWDADILKELNLEFPGVLPEMWTGDELARLIVAEPVPPGEFGKVDPDNLATEFECPKCGYQWAGRPK